jgi:hypothetical protein
MLLVEVSLMPLVTERGRLSREVTEKGFVCGKGIRSKTRQWSSELAYIYWAGTVKVIIFV